MAAVPVYSITRAEIDKFWRRTEVEAEERLLAAEKEAARIMAKALKMEDYVLFEQMMGEILKEGNTGDGATAAMVPAAGGGTEARIIGIKHWWTRSTYAYLNAPALSMDEKGGSKHAITYVPQERCTMFFSSTPCQPYSTAFAIF
jgi:regulator of protease activity HflC (stomatin/prohibitin superfamily)